MCIKKVKLINHDCVPILMLLYVIPYRMLAYLMLLAALSNAVCLHDASFFFSATDFCKCFLLSCFVDTWFVRSSIMRSAFNLLVFPHSMSTQFF